MTTQTNVTEREQNGAERTRTGRWFRPPVDIIENANELLLLADVPGAASDAIDIDFEDGVLTVEATVASRWNEEATPLLQEYGVGNFHRSFRVSEQIDASRIHAEYTDGVLTIHLPKAEAAKPRKIQVQAAG